MRRIIRDEAFCLRARDYLESSRLVTLFTRDHGKVNCIAKGARRMKSRFGAALNLFAVSRVIYYWRETRDLYTLSDAELAQSFHHLAESPEKYVAAEQLAEFVMKTIQPADPHPDLYKLLLTYLAALDAAPLTPQPSAPDPLTAARSPYAPLVCSFLLKAASFLGFRPELRRCLVCRRPILAAPAVVYFDAGRGGTVCASCSGESPTGLPLKPDELAALAALLYSPSAEILEPGAPSSAIPPDFLDLVLSFLTHHFDPLVLNSFRWTGTLRVPQR